MLCYLTSHFNKIRGGNILFFIFQRVLPPGAVALASQPQEEGAKQVVDYQPEAVLLPDVGIDVVAVDPAEPEMQEKGNNDLDINLS